AEAIDCRSDGGYVIAPPSQHMLGEYRPQGDVTTLLELPDWMRPQPRLQPSTRRSPRSAARHLTVDQVAEALRHVDGDDRDGWRYEGPVQLYNDFWAVRPANKFLYLPSGQLWPAESVNKVLPPRMVGRDERDQPVFQNAAEWLMKERGVDSVVFDPALPQIVE